MRIARIVVAAVLALACASASAGQSITLGTPNKKTNGIDSRGAPRGPSCGFNLIPCPKGSQGAGGCYRLGSAQCYDGRICSQGLTSCSKGSQGAGGCYHMGHASCYEGRICSQGLTSCRKGSKGAGGCYALGRASCDNGRIRLY